jgi:hypothetical protein
MFFLKIPTALFRSPALLVCLIGSLLLSACNDSDSGKPVSKPESQKSTTSQNNDDDSDVDSSNKPKDFASIAKSLSALQSHGAQGGEAVELLADALEISPKQAAEWAATLPPGLNKDACLEIVFKGWAQEAPKEIPIKRAQRLHRSRKNAMRPRF